MQDAKLFPQLAKIYGLDGLVRAERGPTRAYGFPGLVHLTDKTDRQIVVKQDNSDYRPISGMRQRDLDFHRRCFDIGVPSPRPVAAVDGTHGWVKDDEWASDYLVFAASEFVEGTTLSEQPVGTVNVEKTLASAGRAAALLRVAYAGLAHLTCTHLPSAKLGTRTLLMPRKKIVHGLMLLRAPFRALSPTHKPFDLLIPLIT